MKKRTKSIRKISIISAGVIVLLMAILLVLRYGSKKDLLQAAESLQAAQTMHATSKLTLNFPPLLRGKDRPFTTATITVDGDVAYTNNNPELTGTLYMEARGRGNVFFCRWRYSVITGYDCLSIREFTGAAESKW